MYVQVINGPVADVDAMKRQNERWEEDVRPGAIGFLGSTGGLTTDGQLVILARFESEEAAKANSDRPEQTQWWAETEKCFSGAPTFEGSSDVVEMLGGGRDDAGFVQIMRAHVADRAKLEELDAQFEALAPEGRPDLLGGLRVWTAPDRYVEAAYFSSEADARAGEAADMPPEVATLMEGWREAVTDMEYLDLTEPWLA